MSVGTAATHLLAEYRGCDTDLLDDLDRIEAMMRRAASAANATVVAATFHRFAPHGITGVVVLEESHFAIHTWPEAGYAALDLFTCGDCEPERAHALVKRDLGAQRCEIMTIHRGLPAPEPNVVAMRVAGHRVDGPDDRDR